MCTESHAGSSACQRQGALRRALAAVCFALALPLAASAQADFAHADPEEKGAQGAGAPQRGVYGFERAATEVGFWGGGTFSSPTLTGMTEALRRAPLPVPIRHVL